MKYEPTNINSRIAWCRLQQQLPSVTREERKGWRAEEAGLVDALFGRDLTAFIRERHRSQFTRYQSGLEDGRALLRLSTLTSCGMTRMEGLGPTPLTTPSRVDSRPIQPTSAMYGESRR